MSDHLEQTKDEIIKDFQDQLTNLKREIKSFKMQGQPADPVRLVEALKMMEWNQELREENLRLLAQIDVAQPADSQRDRKGHQNRA